MSALHSDQITTFTTAYFLSAFIIFFTIRGAVLIHLQHFSHTLYVYTKYLNNNLQQQSFFFTTPLRRFSFII